MIAGMHTWLRRGLVGLLGAVGSVGCTDRTGSEDDGTSSGGAATETTVAETTAAATTAIETTAAETTSGIEACEMVAEYIATAEVLDEGLGPISAPVTILNCLDGPAYVRQDCCYGAAFQLERKDTADGAWRTSSPAVACDCEGFVEPLVIPPSSSIVVDTNPAQYDAEPICEDPYVAIYRWTFVVGPEPDCDDCWQSVPTNEFSWYCEG